MSPTPRTHVPALHMTREQKDEARGQGRWMWLMWGLCENRLYRGEVGTERPVAPGLDHSVYRLVPSRPRL